MDPYNEKPHTVKNRKIPGAVSLAPLSYERIAPEIEGIDFPAYQELVRKDMELNRFPANGKKRSRG